MSALTGNSHYELYPLHLPLLRESLLGSFPLPTSMLQFSGYSWLIEGPIKMISYSFLEKFILDRKHGE